MASMYETLRDLPLLKGLSTDQLSVFLEKTHLRFDNFTPGQKIVYEGDACGRLTFILNGCAKVSQPGTPAVSWLLGNGAVIGAERLFGLDTTYPATITAMGPTSVISFSKEQYLRLLQTEQIYLINYLNYLSLRAQRPVACMRYVTGGSLTGLLAYIVAISTDPQAREIEIHATTDELARMAGIEIAAAKDELEALNSKEVTRPAGEHVTIISRRLIIDAADELA